ncbi:MAG: tetratricopeptide repeat protein [Alphaproteobacteria bacterium]
MILKSKIYKYSILTIFIFCIIAIKYFPYNIQPTINNPKQNFIKEKYNFSNSAYGDYLSASYLTKNLYIEEAAKLYEYSYTKAPNNKILQDYFFTSILSGKIDQALSSFKNNMPNIMLSNLALAIKAIKEGKYSKAENFLSNIKESETDKIIIPIFTIWNNIGENKLKNIEAQFEKLNVSSEKYSLVKLQEAIALDYINYIAQAEESFDDLFTDPQPAHYIIIGANFYERIGKLEKAKKLYKDHINNNPDNILFKQNLKILESENFTFPDKLIQNPKQALAIFLHDISSILYENRLSYQSLIYAQFALYLDPGYTQTNFILGTYYLENKNFTEAIKYFNKIHEDSGIYLFAQINLSTCLYKLKQSEEAKNILINLSKNYPDTIEPFLVLGDIYREEKNYNGALNIYDNLLNHADKNDPRLWLIYYMRAVTNQLNKNFLDSESDYNKALTLNPNNATILNDLAYSFIESNKNIDKAYIMAKKAISISPNIPQFLDTMGWVLYKKGQYLEAFNYLEKASELLPYDATVNEHLGDLYWKLGRIYNAKYEWQHAYDNLTDKHEQERIKDKINNGIK